MEEEDEEVSLEHSKNSGNHSFLEKKMHHSSVVFPKKYAVNDHILENNTQPKLSLSKKVKTLYSRQ